MPASGFGIHLVGARGFEPPTSASRTLRATRLRYAPSSDMYSSEGQQVTSIKDEPYYPQAPRMTHR